MKAIKIFFFFGLLIVEQFTYSQVPFNRGVNLTNWFQTGNVRQIQFTKFTKLDFINIKSLGCDVIRLPINLHFMTNGSPDYIIDPLFFNFLDQAVSWAEDLQIYLILDNHTFDPEVNTDLNVGIILNKVWTQMAQHYKNRSNYILYEVLNEPHGPTTKQWGTIQQDAINAIRDVDIKHTIIVGGSAWNSYNELKNLPVYTDTNLLYTFHFYDPFLFTHQGATWTTPSMGPLAGVPFPYDASRIPECPATLKGTWIESSLGGGYANDGTVAKVKSLIDIAVNFKNTRNADVFCGEFGVYIPNSPDTDRVFWYETVRKYFEENGIPWTIWDYQGGFGLFNKGSSEMFDYDLNIPLIQGLGFNVPEQKVFIMKPDSIGFIIYSDYIGQQIYELSGNSGTIDFYSTDKPNNEDYCLYWTNAAQYNTIGFDFKPDKDLSKLLSEDFALDFFFRGNSQSSKFDIRFIDTKTADTSDHPWRMRYVFNKNVAPIDNYWHHVRIPLKSFTEHGSYDNDHWYEPKGKFDWTAVDRFEMDAEYSAMTDQNIWFDNIVISNEDTAVVHDTSAFIKPVTSIRLSSVLSGLELTASPNPMHSTTTISYCIPSAGKIEISVYNIFGQKLITLLNSEQVAGIYKIAWNGTDDKGISLVPGIYICRISVLDNIKTCMLIKR